MSTVDKMKALETQVRYLSTLSAEHLKHAERINDIVKEAVKAYEELASEAIAESIGQEIKDSSLPACKECGRAFYDIKGTGICSSCILSAYPSPTPTSSALPFNPKIRRGGGKPIN